MGAELSAENHQQLWVPVGFAHGFLTSELAEVQYKASGFWNRDCERSLRWDDPAGDHLACRPVFSAAAGRQGCGSLWRPWRLPGLF